MSPRVILVLLLWGALLGIGAAPAAAKVIHQADGSFNGSDAPGGPFSNVGANAFDQSGSAIYVLDWGAGVVDKFNADGTYAGVQITGSSTPQGSFLLSLTSGVAVDNTAAGPNKGDLYVADHGHGVVDRFSKSGAFECQITGKTPVSAEEIAHECNGVLGSEPTGGPAGFEPGGLAVDSAGDLYVADDAHHAIDEFGPSGEYKRRISDSHLSEQMGTIALDSTGKLYVTNILSNLVEFDSTGAFLRVLAMPSLGSGVDPATNDVYNGGSGSIAEYDSAGNQVDTFGGAGFVPGLAVRGSGGEVYADNFSNGVVEMFRPIVIPDVIANPATQGEQFTATLNGEVDPAGGGEVESCRFEYVTQANFEAEGFVGAAEAACLPATPYAGVTHVSASLSALAPGTTYHFRLAASNSNGIADQTSDQTFTTPALAVTDQATNVTANSATLNGTVNPHGTTITDCHFDYGTTTAYGEKAPCASTPSGSSPVPVSADVTGLAENTMYHFRLVTAYSGGSDAGSDETLTTLSRPVIDKAYTTNLTSSSVDLNAEIDPKGFDTTYRFEWGTSTSYGNSVPVPNEGIGSGTSDVLVSQHLNGLVTGTTYHWRVVATNSIGTESGDDHAFIYEPETTPSGADCPNAQLRTNYSASLPDCRAYELVSPVDKNDVDVKNAFEGQVDQQASLDGERIFYQTAGAYPGQPEALLLQQNLASRGTSGWSTRPVDLPGRITHSPLTSVEYSLPLSPDLSSGAVITEQSLVPGVPGGGIYNLYVGHLLTGSYDLVTDVTPPNRSGVGFQILFVGGSSNLSHVVFYANDALTPDAPPNGIGDEYSLYEWAEGQLRYVGMVPTSGTSCTGAECTPVAGAHAGGGFDSYTDAISADGSRVVFSTVGSVWDRLNGTTTVEVSASQRTIAPTGSSGGSFQAASADGSHVLFTSAAPLTNDAVPGSGSNLYDYDVETGQLTDLTAAADARAGGVVGLSEDGSHVYFTAEGVLATNSNSHGDTAVPGKSNLYLWDRGQTTFIATANVVGLQNEEQAARVSADGSHVAFDSTASLTGYDNTDANTGEPDTEIYLYDADANRLTCASCRPDGSRPIGSSDLHWIGRGYKPRNLSADGSRLFFTSRDALLPGDTNGLYDVYEWEADGSGSCQSSTDNGGCLYLISNGHAASNSYFTDASANGDDVFFSTGDRLVGQDQDEYADLYDARVDGGFPEPPPPAPCEGESCRGEGSHAPAAPGAGTAAFQGPGNPTPKSCKKGLVPRHGKCLRTKHRKKHHPKHRAANNQRRAGR